MGMLTTRLMMILQELMRAKEPLTSEFLSRKIQVTSRTIRNDMKELGEQICQNGADIMSVRGSGYELVIKDDRVFRSFLNEMFLKKPGVIPNSSEERFLYIIQKLLLAETFVKLDELAKEMFVSKSTIQNDLRDVKRVLQRYDISLQTVPNFGVKVKGSELKLRFCMSEYLFINRQVWDMRLDRIPNITSEEISVIRTIILHQIKENEINLSDIAFHNLIIHIAIACARIRNENFIMLISNELQDISQKTEYAVAVQIVKQIETNLHLNFPQSEVAYIAIHLLGNKIISQPLPLENMEELELLLDQDAYSLTMKILTSIEKELGLGLNLDKELIVGITLHLKPAINRHLYSMNIRNPMLEEIKKTYPIAFEAGILASIIIKKETRIEINENEVGYLALHFGAAIERRRIHQTVKRCVIVCASGVGSAAFLKYKLQAEFGSKLEIIGTTEYYRLKDIHFHNIDLVISTIPIKERLPIPVIEVDVLLGKADFEKISNAIKGENLPSLDYTREELVFLQERFETKEEVLQFLIGKLEELGLVGEEFHKAVEEREAFSSTSYGNLVAIPHPITPQTDSTFWAICTLQKPIEWGGKRVQFVCLLCVEKDSSQDLKNMYELLIKIVDSKSHVQELLQCTTYQQFENTLIKTMG